MTPTAIQQINDKLQKLPDKLLNEVNQFLDFLYYKQVRQTDLENLTEEQKQELQQIKSAFEQADLIRQGKLKTRPVENLLNEL